MAPQEEFRERELMKLIAYESDQKRKLLVAGLVDLLAKEGEPFKRLIVWRLGRDTRLDYRILRYEPTSSNVLQLRKTNISRPVPMRA